MKIKNDPSGIEFNLVQSKNAWNIPVLANGNNKIGQNDIQYADEDGISPIFNAVEIDWNGAQVAGKTLNTTGEVLSN